MRLLSAAEGWGLQPVRGEGAFPPGLKPGHCKIKRSRGFENPLPRTEVRGWHSSAKVWVHPTASFSAARKARSFCFVYVRAEARTFQIIFPTHSLDLED